MVRGEKDFPVDRKKDGRKTVFLPDTIDTKGMRIKCRFPDGGIKEPNMRGDERL